MEEHKDLLFLKNLVEGIVKFPEKVELQRFTDELGVFLKMKVAKEDMGVVIGKQGTNVAAIKLLLKLYGINNGSRISLKVEEPDIV